MQIASEESYLQMTDLQSKLQMHDAFQAELKANQRRVDEVVKVKGNLVLLPFVSFYYFFRMAMI